MDTDNADFYKVLEELKATFGPSICPIVVPYVENHKVLCYINLIDNKAYTYGDKGEPSETAMPDFGHRLEGLRVAISEAVAETDEELFENTSPVSSLTGMRSSAASIHRCEKRHHHPRPLRLRLHDGRCGYAAGRHCRPPALRMGERRRSG